MEKQKKNEYLITIIIPLTVGIVLGFFQLYIKEYPTITISILAGVVLIVCMAGYSIKFLQERQRRWEKNGEIHRNIINKIDTLEKDFFLLKRDMDINKKINKLENNIKYLEGKNAK